MLFDSWRTERSESCNHALHVVGSEAGCGGSQQEIPRISSLSCSWVWAAVDGSISLFLSLSLSLSSLGDTLSLAT